MVEGNAVAGGQVRVVGVVGDDRRDVHVELARAPAEQQVVQAVAVLADHHQHARLARQRVQLGVHAELAAQVGEQRVQRRHVGQVRRRLEVHAQEEQPGGVAGEHVAVLLRVDDVAAGLEQQAGDAVHDALGISARQRENELVAVGHGAFLGLHALYEARLSQRS